MYQIEVRHSGLHKYRLIRGRDRYVVEQKARAQQAVWDEFWQRKTDQEKAKQLYEANKERAVERTTEARQAVEEMGDILAHALKSPIAIDWELLKDHSHFTKPRPRQPDKPQLRPAPKANAPEFRHKRVFLWDDLFPRQRYRKVMEGRARFRKAYARWNQERQELTRHYATAIQGYRQALAQLAADEQAFQTAQCAKNTAVDEQRQRYEAKDPEAIAEYCDMVLSKSDYPDGFPQQVDLDYIAETGTLIADCQVPSIEDMPNIKEVKYVRSRGELVDVPLRVADVEKLYDSALYQFSLRTIHELFRTDIAGAIDEVVFNGWLCSTSKTTGHPGCWCLLSVQANRGEFTSINLANVDPEAYFDTLNGVAGAKLHDLTPITPIRQTSGANKRFAPSGDLPSSPGDARPATTAFMSGRSSSVIPQQAPDFESALASLASDAQLASVAKFSGEFIGPGRDLNMGSRGVLHSPMVYVAKGTVTGDSEPSLLDASLPVLRTEAPASALPLPYWPRYSNCMPEQRGWYLRWLGSGRIDPEIPIGYVFIYFYGLERRVLVDHQDHESIIREVLRLMSIYHSSHSFLGYATDFVWTAALLSSNHGGISAETLALAVSSAPPHREAAMATCLSFLFARKTPLPKEIAYTIAALDPKSPRSAVVRRQGQMFRKLFYEKYAATYGDGLVLQASKRTTGLQYHTASSALARLSQGLAFAPIASITGLPSQFDSLISLWSECIEELRAFDRVTKSDDPAAVMTAATYEALPRELRQGDHPEHDAWFKVNNDHVDETGWAVVPVSVLASIKGLAETAKLTKRQCAEILATADVLEFGLEPDARITGKNYAWDQKIALFLLAEEPGQEKGVYPAAAAMLELGMSVALADGTASQDESAYILHHIENHFELTANQKLRLRALQHLLLSGEAEDNRLIQKFETALTLEQRQLIGKYLFAIAAVDQVMTEHEMRVLKKLYRQLGLDAAELDSLVAAAGPGLRTDGVVEIVQGQPGPQGEAIPGQPQPQEKTFALDMDAVNRIMAETRQVADILAAAMKPDTEIEAAELPTEPVEAEAPASQETPATTAVLEQPARARVEGLSPRFQPFLAALSQQASWPAAAFAALARQHKLMPAGAIEAINEWSQEHLGDWVIEEGDPLRVRLDLLKEDWNA